LGKGKYITKSGHKAIVARIKTIRVPGGYPQWILSGAVIVENVSFVHHWNIYGHSLLNNSNYDLILK